MKRYYRECHPHVRRSVPGQAAKCRILDLVVPEAGPAGHDEFTCLNSTGLGRGRSNTIGITGSTPASQSRSGSTQSAEMRTDIDPLASKSSSVLP